ncbi:MAG TPA: zinc ribbon domain-containing protein, partial [Thermoplasmata archaeon]|nr:zinc ribbon domain-containing protein [Thermoplasmata archaeon]
PYPQVVSPGVPSTSPTAAFPNYEASLSLSSSTSLVAGLANRTVAIGQQLNVSVVVTNTGTAPTNNYSVALTYPEATGNVVVATSGLITAPLSAGENVTVPLAWVVNESVTGRQDKASFPVNFGVNATWNGGLPDGGTNSTALRVNITPAFISVTWTPPVGVLPTDASTINSTGVATYDGKGTGTVTVFAVSNGGSRFDLLTVQVTNGTTFETDLSAVPGMTPGTTYTIDLVVTYNGRTYTQTYVNALTVAGSAPSHNILFTNILGLPLWIWLVIAAAIVLGVVGFLMLSGRFARGRLVECGECGNLIPENATVCPKCGAEFETDLVRCSRCGSTIPSTSAVCPECAATLLARAGPESSDPERQSYADFVERFRTEAKKELGANYSEGAFWDWWRRQQSYVSFSQWRLQQAQGTRTGMTAPVATEASVVTPPRRPPSGGAPPGAVRAAPGARPPAARPAPRTAPAATPPARPAAPAPTPTPASDTPAVAAGAEGAKSCPNCGKQINAEFLVCPFCGSVTG